MALYVEHMGPFRVTVKSVCLWSYLGLRDWNRLVLRELELS